MIKVNNIIKTFDSEAFKKPVEVLKGVNFSLAKGRTIGFLGANGAGKTTLMKIIMGFIYPSSGKVEFSKELGFNQLDALKNIGYMPERPYFYPYLKGIDFIKYVGELSHIDQSTLEKNTKYWGDRLKISHALNRELKGYSKGMLQRIGFMAALIHDPKIIILDEPLSGLDPLGRKEFKDVIREVKELGKTIFFSSHIVSDIEEVCDEVIFLKEGQIVFQGNLQEVYNNSDALNFEATLICRDFHKLEKFSKATFEKLSESLVRATFTNKEKRGFLNWVTDQSDIELSQVSPIGQTLEEVFYFSDKENLENDL